MGAERKGPRTAVAVQVLAGQMVLVGLHLIATTGMVADSVSPGSHDGSSPGPPMLKMSVTPIPPTIEPVASPISTEGSIRWQACDERYRRDPTGQLGRSGVAVITTSAGAHMRRGGGIVAVVAGAAVFAGDGRTVESVVEGAGRVVLDAGGVVVDETTGALVGGNVSDRRPG